LLASVMKIRYLHIFIMNFSSSSSRTCNMEECITHRQYILSYLGKREGQRMNKHKKSKKSHFLLMMMIMSVEWDYISDCGHQRAYCSYPRWYTSMESQSGMMMLTQENTWLIHQSSGNPITRHLVAIRSNVQKEWEFSLAKYFCSYLQMNF
jgi:hypothetical protein